MASSLALSLERRLGIVKRGRVGERVILGRIGRGFAFGEYVVLDGSFELFKGLGGTFEPI
jgi:hypothetical protein